MPHVGAIFWSHQFNMVQNQLINASLGLVHGLIGLYTWTRSQLTTWCMSYMVGFWSKCVQDVLSRVRLYLIGYPRKEADKYYWKMADARIYIKEEYVSQEALLAMILKKRK